ncbi:hypothetical protein [Candidatus Nitrotoga fabula]|uniref:Uncharacterized protein n=1 Tax=Candidatus Nitrotoga fabula TaxID=2182327 RepID=A0A916FAU9_9PROT|nr:hypothetical protein [Candidatus Nitrotoga fabula]CAE6710297.1 conserved hypothetical protein [Candidatus Nitrotoga fabula]
MLILHFASNRLYNSRAFLTYCILAGVSLFSGCQNITDTPSIGFVDHPTEEIVRQTNFLMSGWALDQDGIENVAAILDEHQHFSARIGIPRQDVALAYPTYPGKETAGFEITLNLPPSLSGKHQLQIVATDKKQRKTIIGKKTLIAGNTMKRWLPLLENAHPGPEKTFYFLFATSGISLGGAQEIAEQYAPYNSATVKAGFRVPILYLRTTKGYSQDWEFDPNFDNSMKCGKRQIADDSLNDVIRFSTEKKLPILFTLNGGVWADAACDAPSWDINDQLEKEPLNCQWNERNQVMNDDYLKTLPGSQDAPELARGLTLNVYASDVRRYKKRNLQAAGRVLLEFAQNHPDLFVGISLDPDVYNNPFFEGEQWYDYNPLTLRQFREWLKGDGPYSGQPTDGAPDLRNYRKKSPLTLKEVNQLARKNWKNWNEVQPPRIFSTASPPYWKDPWVREWELFRRHLVDLHYDELSQWLTDAGIPTRHIFSSQGFPALSEPLMPFAVNLDSPVKNYDSGGMTIEGAKPNQGHLGAILYGPSAVNSIRMENNDSLFAAFRRFDEDWAVIEHNTSDFRSPSIMANYADGYRSLREMFNHGARFVSPMAWNGSNGIYAGQKDFAAFTAIRNTPLEDAIRDFMISHANLPRHARYWGFGSLGHKDTDGWNAVNNGQIISDGGSALLMPATGTMILQADLETQIEPEHHKQLILGLAQPDDVLGVTAEVLDAVTQKYIPITDGKNIPLKRDTLGIHLPLTWNINIQPKTMRITIRFRDEVEKSKLNFISLHPANI